MTADAPDEALALARHAGLLAKQGDAGGAADAATRALAIDPACALAHRHLAVAHLQRHDPAAAATAAARAVALAPGEAGNHELLGAALAGLEQFAPARAAFARAAALSPTRAEPWFNAGAIAMSAGDHAGAVAAHCAALARDPRFRPSLVGLAHALHALDRGPEAAAVWARVAALDPADAGARHLVDALTGGNPAAPPPGYVASTFDSYAARFDRHLAQLRYDGPALVHAAVAAGAPYARALDLGCGTGLAGVVLRPLCARLDGVDLSSGMLARAAERGLYDSLAEADVVAHLAAAADPYDLIVAADVLAYVGDLAPWFAALRPRLAPGGTVVFTVERGDPADADGFQLQPTGRYRHAAAYVEALAARSDLTVAACREAPLRDDADGPVIALVYVLTS